MSCLNLMLPVWRVSASVYNSSSCAARQGENHTDLITPKLCGSCYVVRSGFYISNPDPLKDYFVSFLLWGRATIVPTTDKQEDWKEPSICRHIFPHHSVFFGVVAGGGRGISLCENPLAQDQGWTVATGRYSHCSATVAVTQPLTRCLIRKVLSSGVAAASNYLSGHEWPVWKQLYTLRYVNYLGKYDSPSAARSFALSWCGRGCRQSSKQDRFLREKYTDVLVKGNKSFLFNQNGARGT
jgi:hypothetical protein